MNDVLLIIAAVLFGFATVINVFDKAWSAALVSGGLFAFDLAFYVNP